MELNELDSTCGISDEELTLRFKRKSEPLILNIRMGGGNMQ